AGERGVAAAREVADHAAQPELGARAARGALLRAGVPPRPRSQRARPRAHESQGHRPPHGGAEARGVSALPPPEQRVVVRVGADPEPHDEVTIPLPDGAVALRDAGGVEGKRRMHALEPEALVVRVALELPVGRPYLPPDILR